MDNPHPIGTRRRVKMSEDENYDGYAEHNGQIVTIFAFQAENESGDRDIWTVQADDGWTGHAFEDELFPIDA